jgi:hypothetical protein
MIEKGLTQLLNQMSSLTSLLAKQPDSTPCIFWDYQTKGTKFPSVVMQVAQTTDVYSSKGANNLRFKRVQFDSYGESAFDAIGVSDTVRNLLKSYRGSLPDGTQVTGSMVQRDQSMPPEMGSKTSVLYRRLIEIEFQYYETAVNPFVTELAEPVIDGGTQ